MASYTSNFNLKKPDNDDFYSIDDQNENMDLIDEKLGEHQEKLDGIDDGANKTIVDSELDETSENPVQNKVVSKPLLKLKKKHYYGICNSAKNVYDKIVDCEDFVLEDGVIIEVKFVNGHDRKDTSSLGSGITLNVNNTGEIRTYIDSSSMYGCTIQSGAICRFIYEDGSYPRFNLIGMVPFHVNYNGTSFDNASYDLVTEKRVYDGTPTINDSKRYYSDTKIYAPTSAGTKGQILQSNGSGAPVWGTGTSNYYGTCSTASSTSAKIVGCEDFVLGEGAIIDVLFNNANTASSMTLNVNSTGAKDVYIFNSTILTITGKIPAGSICRFRYDGTKFDLLGMPPRQISDSSSASSLSTGTYFVTERDVYYGMPKINNSKSYNSDVNIYVPTSVGIKGQILQSSGNKAPSWATVISSNSAITEVGQFALDAVENNASVDGTLANQIAKLMEVQESEATLMGSWYKSCAKHRLLKFGKIVIFEFNFTVGSNMVYSSTILADIPDDYLPYGTDAGVITVFFTDITNGNIYRGNIAKATGQVTLYTNIPSETTIYSTNIYICN